MHYIFNGINKFNKLIWKYSVIATIEHSIRNRDVKTLYDIKSIWIYSYKIFIHFTSMDKVEHTYIRSQGLVFLMRINANGFSISKLPVDGGFVNIQLQHQIIWSIYYVSTVGLEQWTISFQLRKIGSGKSYWTDQKTKPCWTYTAVHSTSSHQWNVQQIFYFIPYSRTLSIWTMDSHTKYKSNPNH